MKIVHICLGFPIEFPGGITNYVASLSRIQGIENEVIVYSGSNVNNLQCVSKGRFKNKRFDSSIRTFSLDLLAEDDKISVLFNDLVSEHADVYHFHSVLGVDIRFLKMFSECSPKLNYYVSFHDYNMLCPRVYMVDKWNGICHTVDEKHCSKCIGVLEQIEPIKKISEKIGIKLPTIESKSINTRNVFFKQFLNSSKGNFAVSNRVKEIYSFFNDIEIDVITIGNDSAKEFKTRHYTMLPGLTVGFLGSFNEKKGAKIFTDICRKVKSNAHMDINFVMYGRGDKALIEEFEASGGIYKGPYTPDMLKDILKDIHIGCVLSIWEDNGPQVTMEFINNGIPTIGTNRGGIPDFIKLDTGLIIEPENIDEAVNWLTSIDLEQLNYLCSKIEPLKTPEYHALELLKRYQA